MTSYHPPLARTLNLRSLLVIALIIICAGSAYFIYGLQQLNARLAQTHELIEQRFNIVLAQSIWDLDLNNTQQLLDSIARLDGVNKVELQTTLGQRLSSKNAGRTHNELIRDFPIASERSGKQPIATLRVYLGKQALINKLLLETLALACAGIFAQLTLLGVLQWTLRQQLNQQLEIIGSQLNEDLSSLDFPNREINNLARLLNRERLSRLQDELMTQAQLATLQQQREQLGELLTLRTQELELLSRQMQWLHAQSSRLINLHNEDGLLIIEECLHRLQRLLNVDQINFIKLPGTRADEIWKANLSGVDAELFLNSPWLRPLLEARQTIKISNRNDFPPDGHSEFLTLSESGIQSLFLQPTFIAGRHYALLACQHHEERDWNEAEQALIGTTANLLSSLCMRHNLHELISRQQSRLQDAEHMLSVLPFQDGLTCLANPVRLQNEKKHFLELAFSHQIALSVLLIDIDHFRTFNSIRGNSAGDDCLVRIAQSLQKIADENQQNGRNGLAVRYSGKSFLLVLPGKGREQAEIVAQQLVDEVYHWQIPHPASSTPFVTISIGVATISLQRHNSIEEVIDDARQALHLAKQLGRNRYSLPPIH